MGEHPGAAFLRDLFGPSTTSPVFVCSLLNVENRTGNRGDEQFTATRAPDEIAAFARRQDRAERGVYFCVATLQPGAPGRAKGTLDELNCLHADLDFKSINAEPDEVRRALQTLPCPPSVVNATGNGLHALWLFREALKATPETIAEVERLLRRLVDVLAADPAAAECSRLLRLPGTHNTKRGAWVEVTVEVCEPQRRYDLGELAEWLDEARPLLRPVASDGIAADNPFAAFGRQHGGDGYQPPIDIEARLAAMRYEAPGDAGVHLTQLAVSASMLARGSHADEVVELLLAATRTAAGEHGARWDWAREERAIRGICESWLEKHPQSPTPRPRAPLESPLLRPFVPRPAADIPPRRWLHARHYIRRHVVMTVAPGGYGKSALEIANAVEMCLGRGLLGSEPVEGGLKVAYWNAEDPDDEIERRVAAFCQHHGVNSTTLAGRLFVGSRLPTGRRFVRVDRTGTAIVDHEMFAALTALVTANTLDCVIIDPLAAFHGVPENDNGLMEQVVSEFARIAEQTNCCIELTHHTRKRQGAAGEFTDDDSRGASAITYAVRSVRVLNRMAKEEAALPGVDLDERALYLRIDRFKRNLAPPEKATWIRLAPVALANGDNVQAVEAWSYPDASHGAPPEIAAWAREEVARKAYRTSARAPDWFGYALAAKLGLSVGQHHEKRSARESAHRERVYAVIASLETTGALGRETRRDPVQRKDYEYFRPGAGGGRDP
jgi:hypothetical protein